MKKQLQNYEQDKLKEIMKHLFDGLVAEKRYMKLKEGETKFRIVQNPISGWLDWKDKKPYRYKLDQKPSSSFDPETPMKAFLGCYVWDYEKNALFILEITQVSILKALKGFCESEDWGDLTGYDIKVKRTGSGNTTKYFVEPVPPKPMGGKVLEALEASPVRLEALYEGKDPWSDLEGPVNSKTQNVENKSMMTPLEQLQDLLAADSIPSDGLMVYLKGLSDKGKATVEAIVAQALQPQYLAKFKAAYLKSLAA